MVETITTKTVGKNIAEVEEEFLLEETPLTRLIFHAQLCDKGVRGKIIRLKKDKDNQWVPDKSLDFRKLKSDEGLSVEISSQAMEKLEDALLKVRTLLKQQGIEYGRNQYITAKADEVIVTNRNKAHYINELLNKGYSEEIWRSLIEKDPDLATRMSLSRIYHERKKVVDEYRSNISSDKPEEYWQHLLASNNWLFGNSYIGRVGERRINISSTLDHPLIAEDGCLEIVEIKKPSTSFWTLTKGGDKFLYRKKYRIHHPELECAISQARNYIFEAEREIDSREWANKHDGIFPLKPRGLVVFGRSNEWDEEDIQAFRLLNDSLHGISVITFDHLLSRAEQILLLVHPKQMVISGDNSSPSKEMLWSAIDNINERISGISALMRGCKINLSENNVTIITKFKFHYDRFQAKNLPAELQTELKTITGKQYSVSCVMDSSQFVKQK